MTDHTAERQHLVDARHKALELRRALTQANIVTDDLDKQIDAIEAHIAYHTRKEKQQ